MAQKSQNGQPAAVVQEISELRSRLDWLDEERRKSTRRMAELEQRTQLQDREIEGRDQRIKELEERLSAVTAQVARLPQFDTQLVQFKDEIVDLIESYDGRRIRSEKEMEQLRRVEQETNAREISEIRRELPAIGRLQNEMELRQAEEARLANLIGVLQNRLPPIESRIEGWSSDLAYLEETERQNSRNIQENQTAILEINKRWEPIRNRMDIIADKQTKLDANMRALSEAQQELRKMISGWAEQVQLGEYERNQRLNSWERFIEDMQNELETYTRQWVQFSDQYKEAKMAVETLGQWQEHIESRQRETAELTRVEFHRMQGRWENFTAEHDKAWKNFEVDMQQRWQNATRNERQIREEINKLEEKAGTLKQDLEMVWRVQSAQTDALKQFPRIWQEEVENTLNNDPNRRRQPTLVQVNEDF
jgi:chromosome segregation ATPase